MLGRILGKIAAEVILSPLTVASETMKAVDAGIKQSEKIVDRAFDEKKEV